MKTKKHPFRQIQLFLSQLNSNLSLMRSTIPLIFLASCIEGVGDYNLKRYAMENKKENLLYGLISYGALIYTLIEVWKKDKLSISNVVWNSFSTVINYGIGITQLNERPTIEENIGTLLSLSGMVVISKVPAKT